MTEGDRRLHETLSECEITINLYLYHFLWMCNACVCLHSFSHDLLVIVVSDGTHFFAQRKSIYFYDYVYFFALFKVISVKLTLCSKDKFRFVPMVIIHR